MTTTKYDFTKLTADLKAGLLVAKQVAAATHDGGTCNFDAPKFHFDRSPSPKVRAEFEKAATEAGVPGYWTGDTFGRHQNRRFVFGPGCGGQGHSRTKAAEALKDHLVAAGWDVSMYYQAD